MKIFTLFNKYIEHNNTKINDLYNDINVEKNYIISKHLFYDIDKINGKYLNYDLCNHDNFQYIINHNNYFKLKDLLFTKLPNKIYELYDIYNCKIPIEQVFIFLQIKLKNIKMILLGFETYPEDPNGIAFFISTHILSISLENIFKYPLMNNLITKEEIINLFNIDTGLNNYHNQKIMFANRALTFIDNTQKNKRTIWSETFPLMKELIDLINPEYKKLFGKLCNDDRTQGKATKEGRLTEIACLNDNYQRYEHPAPRQKFDYIKISKELWENGLKEFCNK